MQTTQKIRKHQQEFLDKAKARQKAETFVIQGIAIVVNPGVFPPATDTKLLASSVNVQKGDRVLDATTGSGIIPIIAGMQGATGVGVDINPKAVQNAKENVLKYKVNMDVVESDLFNSLLPERFDYIFANGPFFEGNIRDPLDYACYGARSFIKRLFSELHRWLKPSGKLFIVVSQWSELTYFLQTAKKNNLLIKRRESRKSDDGEREYLLYEVTIK